MTARPRLRVPRALLIAAAVVVVAIVAARLLLHPRVASLSVPVATVGRQDVAVTIEATGTVEPIHLVEIKSKASGQILVMPVEVGSHVRAGALLAQIDTNNVANQYAQALAALRAAQAKVDISGAQKQRSDDLFKQNVITVDEHEAALLDYANAQAQLANARANLDIARQQRDDATVRAPVEGTVLSQSVTAGQVISSATSSASGGTSLLTMADLRSIRMRALVAETDVGSLRPGESATVTVDAFPQRPFQGQVEKIEPQSVVQQSVTMFPVLISISNEEGLLLPGMNGEVSMLVDQRQNALAVPVDAVRSVRELPAVAAALGMDPDSLRAEVQRQQDARMRARAARTGFGGDSAHAMQAWPAGDPAADSSARRRWAAGRGGAGAAGGWRARGGTGGEAGGPGGASRSWAGGRSGAGGGAGGSGASAGGFSGASSRNSRAQVVFVKTARGLEPRIVRLGITNFDYAEVLDGVSEGDQVALLGVAEIQAKRQQDQSRMRQRMGGGVPGVPTGGGGGRPGGGGH